MIAPKIAEELPLASAAAAIQAACARIAPTWPLDRFIAVNPLWGMIDRPLPEVAGQLRALSGATLLMPRAWYRGAYQEGRFGDAHLQAAIDESGSPRTLADLRALLDQAEPSLRTRQRVVDVADAERDLTHEVAWRSFVLHSVSQWCAGYFDDGQASLGPSREGGLYASWRRYAIADRSPGLSMGATAFRSLAAALPAQADALTSAALTALGVPPEHRETYLWGLLLDQNGWASWCAYRRWTAQLDGRDDGSLADLLAIRLAWEWLLLQLGGAPRARRWRQARPSRRSPR